jgi:hypothetical protein
VLAAAGSLFRPELPPFAPSPPSTGSVAPSPPLALVAADSPMGPVPSACKRIGQKHGPLFNDALAASGASLRPFAPQLCRLVAWHEACKMQVWRKCNNGRCMRYLAERPRQTDMSSPTTPWTVSLALADKRSITTVRPCCEIHRLLGLNPSELASILQDKKPR